jgi:hypothetical protein
MKIGVDFCEAEEAMACYLTELLRGTVLM